MKQQELDIERLIDDAIEETKRIQENFSDRYFDGKISGLLHAKQILKLGRMLSEEQYDNFWAPFQKPSDEVLSQEKIK